MCLAVLGPIAAIFILGTTVEESAHQYEQFTEEEAEAGGGQEHLP